MFTRKKRVIEIDGEAVPIDPDFRIMCRYSAAVMRNDRAAAAKSAGDFFFAGLPDGISPERAVREMQDFYILGLAPGTREEKKKEEKPGKKPAPPCFDFEEDEGYFYAAFLGEYGIDLTAVEEMHWFDFCALFMGLPDECRLKCIISIRAQNMSDEKTAAGKARLSRLKKIFGLRFAKKEHYNSVAERDKALKAEVKNLHEQALKKVKGGV